MTKIILEKKKLNKNILRNSARCAGGVWGTGTIGGIGV